MLKFNTYAEATAYYQHLVNKQKERVVEEVKKLRELEALLEHNKKMMYKTEVDNYG